MILLPILIFLPTSEKALALDKDLGQFYRFYAHQYRENGHKVCNAYARPTMQSQPTRGNAVSINITNRPSLGERHVISLNMGAKIRASVPVVLTVEQMPFYLNSYETFAFPKPSQEKKLLQLLKDANTMVVRATLQNGTKVTDAYSLRGVISSVRTIDRACLRP